MFEHLDVVSCREELESTVARIISAYRLSRSIVYTLQVVVLDSYRLTINVEFRLL